MRYLFGFLGAVVFAAHLAPIPSIASAQAQSDLVVVSPGQLEIAQPSELESRLADLEAAYQEANVRKPRTGVAMSVVVMTAGTILVMAGTILRREFLGAPPTEQNMRTGGALIGTGSVTIAAGVGGLAFSGVRLKRAKRERRRIEPEIASLRSALDSGTK